MILILAGLLMLGGLSFLAGAYFRRAEAGVIESQPVWDRLIANINRLAVDDTVPDKIVEDLSLFAAIAGCGCFIAGITMDVLFHTLTRKLRRSDPTSEVSMAVRSLRAEQKEVLGRVLQDLLIFDSLHSPVLGALFRHAVGAVAAEEADGDRKQRLNQVHTMMLAAHEIATRRLKQHRVPGNLLPLTQG